MVLFGQVMDSLEGVVLLDGGSTSLGVGCESCRLVPFPVQPYCLLCVEEDRAFSFLRWLPVVMFPSLPRTFPAGTVSQINDSISCHSHGIVSQCQKLISVPPISLQLSPFTPTYPPQDVDPSLPSSCFCFPGWGCIH